VQFSHLGGLNVSILNKYLLILLAAFSLLSSIPATSVASDAPQNKVVCLYAKFFPPKGVTMSSQHHESVLKKTLNNIPADELALINKCYADWKASPTTGVEAKLPYIVSRGPTALRLLAVLCVGDSGFVYDKNFTPSKNFLYQFKASELKTAKQSKEVKKWCK